MVDCLWLIVYGLWGYEFFVAGEHGSDGWVKAVAAEPLADVSFVQAANTLAVKDGDDIQSERAPYPVGIDDAVELTPVDVGYGSLLVPCEEVHVIRHIYQHVAHPRT